MILKAAWVVPITSPPIRDGCVEISADRIARVGAWSELRPSSPEVTDVGAAILTPGLVNPHTHLELCCYAGRLEPGPFLDWIEKLIKLRGEPMQLEREKQGVVEGARLSLRAGVTCVGDISRRNCAWPLLKSLPIRKVCFVELLTLADHPPRDPNELREGVRSVVEDSLLTVGVSPHTPYTVPADQIRDAIRLADQLRRPWTMHLAETAEEVAFLHGRTGAFGPTIESLLRRCGVTSPRRSPIEFLDEVAREFRRGALAHANYIADDELGRLADAGHVVIYCPRSHHFFGHAPHPFKKMLAAGVPVTFGTDSLASNQSLALLDELHYVHSHLPDPPPPDELLRMATLEAARALNLDDYIGSLEAGKQADLAAFGCPSNTVDPVRSMIESPVEAQAVWVAGRRVV